MWAWLVSDRGKESGEAAAVTSDMGRPKKRKEGKGERRVGWRD
jgi:hypothetical protein